MAQVANTTAGGQEAMRVNQNSAKVGMEGGEMMRSLAEGNERCTMADERCLCCACADGGAGAGAGAGCCARAPVWNWDCDWESEQLVGMEVWVILQLKLSHCSD